MSGIPPPSSPTVSTLQAPYAIRKIDLTFQLGTGSYGNSQANQLSLTGLRVFAHLEKVISPHMATNVILRVYGMTLDHMNTLSYAGLQYKGRRNIVQVRAGDEVSGMTTVANATIMDSYPVLSGDADSRHFYVFAAGVAPDIQLKPIAPTSYPGSVPASQVLQTLAQQAGLSLQNNGVSAVLSSPYFPGTIWQQIRAAVNHANCFAYLDSVNGKLIIWPKSGATAPNATVVVSPDNGMIEYPQFEAQQIIVRTLFNPTFAIGPGTRVLVRSTLQAANNAKMTITGVTHILSSQMQDGPWETTLIGVPQQ